MALNLRNRNFLKELDFTPEELLYLITLSAQLKAAKAAGYEQPRLRGRNIALIFEKTWTTDPGRVRGGGPRPRRPRQLHRA